MAAREAWGLELGQSAIRLVKIQRSKGKAQIVDYAHVPLQMASGELNYEDPELIEIMARTVKEKGIGKTPVFASIPGQNSFFRDFPLPAISSGKLNEIVSYEARQQIPYPLEEVLWDYHHHEPEEDGAELSISLVCCRHDIVNSLLNFLKLFDLNVAGIQVGPVALANFIMYDQPPEGIALVLDTGARATDLLVFGKHHFWLRSIAGGGNELTSALMEKFNLPYGEAEDLKRKMGESPQADRVFQVVSPVLRGLTSEIQRSLGWYKSQHRGVRISSLICAGGTFLLPGVKEFIGGNIRMPAALIGKTQVIGFGEDIDAAAFNSLQQTFGPAIGLALQGVGEATMEINLLPPEVKLRQMIKAKFVYAVAIVALLAVLTAVSFFSTSKRADKWDSFLQSSEKVVGPRGSAQRQKQKLSEIQAKVKPIKEKIKTLAQIARNRGDIQIATSAVWKIFQKINQRRAAMIKQAKYDSLDNVTNLTTLLFNKPEVQNALAAKKGAYITPDELEKEIRKQCMARAKQLISRRRRIFITEMEAESKYETWYLHKEIDADGNEIKKLISPAQKLALLNVGKSAESPGGRGVPGPPPMMGMAPPNYATPMFGGPPSITTAAPVPGGEEESTDKNAIPVHVVWLRISGFSVSKPDEKAKDVISLNKDFKDVPGIISSEVIPAAGFTKNDLPVLAYHYGSAAEIIKENWVIVQEETIEFEMELAYLPEKYWKDLPDGVVMQKNQAPAISGKENITNADN